MYRVYAIVGCSKAGNFMSQLPTFRFLLDLQRPMDFRDASWDYRNERSIILVCLIVYYCEIEDFHSSYIVAYFVDR